MSVGWNIKGHAFYEHLGILEIQLKTHASINKFNSRQNFLCCIRNYFTTTSEESQMILDSWCDTLCTDLLGGGPELLCAFQWYVTETLVCNLPAESQSGTQIIRK